MKINNAGYNHTHDSDFLVDRPEGSGDCLMILLKTAGVFVTEGREQVIPENSVFIFKKGSPQHYRALSKGSFSNDWIHFEFEGEEEKKFLELGLEYERPYTVSSINFLSFCIKTIVSEFCSSEKNRIDTMSHFMFLIFNKVSDSLVNTKREKNENYFEVLSTIRNKIYSRPYDVRTVETSAHEVRMSVSNFQHLYKKYFSVSFVKDVIKSRIEYASMLLESTNLSAEDIAQQSGYNHYAHFVRQFRDVTGVTPTEYRKNREVF